MSQTVYNSSALPGGQVSPIYRGDATVRLADWVIRAGAIYSMATDRKVYRASSFCRLMIGSRITQ